MDEKGKVGKVVEAADSLSLGISIVVAIFIGIGLGFFLQKVTNSSWTLWIGVFIGVAAAILNVYKAYSKQYKEYEKLAKERNEKLKPLYDDEDEDDFGASKI